MERCGAATAKPKPTESPSGQMGRREGRRIISVPSLVTQSTYSLSPLFSTGHISIDWTDPLLPSVEKE